MIAYNRTQLAKICEEVRGPFSLGVAKPDRKELGYLVGRLCSRSRRPPGSTTPRRFPRGGRGFRAFSAFLLSSSFCTNRSGCCLFFANRLAFTSLRPASSTKIRPVGESAWSREDDPVALLAAGAASRIFTVFA